MTDAERAYEAQARYGEHHWWDSTDLREAAYYQLNEPVLLTTWHRFHEGLELLLGRPVWTHELAFNLDGLKHEAEQEWNGVETSEDEKERAISDGFSALIERVGSERVVFLVLGEE